MPHPRRLPRIATTGRIAVRVTTLQRDIFLADPALSRDLAHGLRRAAVNQGKLRLSVGREALDQLIAAAAKTATPDRAVEREISALLDYLESLADRFIVPDEEKE
jgi:hypothetical protein